MSHLKTVLFATAAVLSSSSAFALIVSPGPVVNDPNFNQTVTSPNRSYYGIAAWGASNPPLVNPTFAGNLGFDANNQWNNGTPGNGEAKVGFINNSVAATPGFISQVISGFVVGDSYVITMLANGRTGQGAAGLTITVGAPAFVPSGPALAALTLPATVFASAIPAVDPVAVSVTTFRTVTSQAFIANAGSLNVTLSNSGVQGSTLLISGFALTDVTSVPEPVSLAVLGTGLLGLAMMRRRR